MQHFNDTITKYLLRDVFILLAFFGVALQAHTQYYETGQAPASVNWQQIHTEHFQLIFPMDIQDEANKLANILESIYHEVSHSLSHQPKKLPIVLYSHTVKSNGLVSWAPKRMETYVTPPQRTNPQKWLEQLAIHELRHVVQLDKLNRGLTQILYYALGEQAIGLSAGFMPNWFYEGDAICAETGLSQAGRGRDPSFEMKIRAIELDSTQYYSYEKAKFGSYKNYVPDHYQYGYHLTAYARQQYGTHIWDSVLNYVGNYPITLWPSYFGLKKYTGLSKNQLYRESLDTLRNLWQQQYNSQKYTNHSIINKNKSSTYTHYRSPQYLNDSVIVAEKKGIDQIAQFIRLKRSNGQEQVLHTPGFYSSLNLSCSGDQIIWGEYQPDRRWEKQNYYLVQSYNVKHHTASSLTAKSRLFSPELSPNGQAIAAIEMDNHNQCNLVLLDTTGERVNTISTPGYSLQFPSWDPNGNTIYATAVTAAGKGIVSYSLTSRNWDTVLPPTKHNIRKPVAHGSYIYFTGDYSGIDNIYAYHTRTDTIFQLTSARYGAYEPAIHPKDHKLLYSNYTSQGYNIVEADIDSLLWNPLKAVEDHSPQWAQTLTQQEAGPIQPATVSDSIYTHKNYAEWKHLFRFHSWMPFYFNYDQFHIKDPDIYPGLRLLSQNNLGSAITTLSYAYKNEHHHIYNTFTYKGWYPAFKISTHYGGFPPVNSTSGTEELQLKPDYLSLNANLYLPLNLTEGSYIKGFRPEVTYAYHNAYYSSPHYSLVRGRHQLGYRIFLYNYRKTSHRDIHPRWGQTLSLNYNHSIIQSQSSAASFYAKAGLYLPGLLAHHSLKCTYGFQKNFLPSFLSSTLKLPRGYTYNQPFYAEKLETLHMNYAFPIAYPDIKFTSLLYIKRLKGNLFYDYAHIENGFSSGESKLYNTHLNSFGLELTTDFHAFHFRFPFTFGGRFSYLPRDEQIRIGGIFKMNLSVF